MTKKTTKTKSKSKCLVTYVENCSPKAKLFNSEKAMQTFIRKFWNKYKQPNDGFWIDLSVTGITGHIASLDESYNLFEQE